MCAWHIKFKEWLQFEHCVVEKLLLSVKLVSPFRNHSSVLWSQLTFKLVAFFAWSHWCNGDNLKMWLNVTQVSFAVWRKGLALREVRFLVLFVPVDSKTLCPLHSVNSLACLHNCPNTCTVVLWSKTLSQSQTLPLHCKTHLGYIYPHFQAVSVAPVWPCKQCYQLESSLRSFSLVTLAIYFFIRPILIHFWNFYHKHATKELSWARRLRSKKWTQQKCDL